MSRVDSSGGSHRLPVGAGVGKYDASINSSRIRMACNIFDLITSPSERRACTTPAHMSQLSSKINLISFMTTYGVRGIQPIKCFLTRDTTWCTTAHVRCLQAANNLQMQASPQTGVCKVLREIQGKQVFAKRGVCKPPTIFR